MTQSKCVSGLSENLESEWDVVLTTINNKHIQSAQFQVNLENPNVCFLQNDFAMSYSCEYLNEIQSALWNCQNVMLFTVAFIYKSVYI